MATGKKVVVDVESIGLVDFISRRFGVSNEEAESFLDEMYHVAQAGTVDGVEIPPADLGDEVLEGKVVGQDNETTPVVIHDDNDARAEAEARALLEFLKQGAGFSFDSTFVGEEEKKPFKIGFNRS